MQMPYYEEDERSTGELLSDLTNQIKTMVGKEVELARIEMTQKAGRMSKGLIILGAGGVLAYSGFLILLTAFSLIIGIWLPFWLSFLIIAIVAIAAGGILLLAGKKRMQKMDLKPTQAITTLKENLRWIKQQT